MLPPHPTRRSAGASPHPDFATLSDEEQAALDQAKKVLREAVRHRRAARPQAEREADDRARTERVLDFLGDVDALRVACYLSVEPEPATLALVEELTRSGARVMVPFLSRQPDWGWYAGAESLEPGLWGIPQPTGPRLGPEALAKADVNLCSALAVTPTGERLGVGGGWYDRAREFAPEVPTVALVNDFEVMDALPQMPWDVPVDVVITPTRTLDCHRG